MSVHRSVIAALSMGVLALGLAACGGGGGGGGGSDTVARDAAQRMAVLDAIDHARDAVEALDDASADTAVEAADALVEAARTVLEAADALSEGEKDAYDTNISAIAGTLSQARMDIETAREERRMAREADIARLRAALDGDAITGISVEVEHGAAPVLSGTIPGATPVAVAGLATRAVAGSAVREGRWAGAAYSAADAASGIADSVVFYTDIEAPGTQPFSGEGGKYSTANGLDADGNLPIVVADHATLIAAPGFPTGPAIRTHPAGTDGTVSVAGTFDGGAGAYVCAPAMGGACTSSIRAGGGIALAGGTDGWTFVPDSGAMVAESDAAYSWFGWWLRDLGESYAVGAFHGGAGDDAADFANFVRLQGMARYSGPAAGRYAFDPEMGEAEAGAFTASATLAVDFADAAAPGSVTGTVDGFEAGGTQRPWSVALEQAAIAADGTIGGGATVWSIDGAPGAAPGSPGWSGRFRDVDADLVPRTATGIFDAEHGGLGRITGAFGATRAP